MSSITRILHTTWDYFTSQLPDRFSRSPKVVKEAIMTDINHLIQEFWGTSSGGVEGASLFAMRRLFEILQKCSDIMEVCFVITSVFAATAVDLANINLQMSVYWHYSEVNALDDQINFNILLDGYRKMLDHSLSISKDLGDMLRFLPGVVVQKDMSIQGMADLYRIKLDLLEHLIKFIIEPLKSSSSRYILDDYLSDFLQDRDRSQLYYCDPMVQHISICRHFLSIVRDTTRSNANDLHQQL